MNAGLLRWLFVVLLALSAILRIAVIRMHPSPHPDAFFQYLEPPWWHLHGYGWPSWEWAVGLRSWVLPAYNGAWMQLLDWLRVKDPARILFILQLHWALLSVSMVAAAWRAGKKFAASSPTKWGNVSVRPLAIDGWQGALLGGVLAAGFGPLLYYSVQTLSEVPSAILATWGYVFWLDARGDKGRRAARAGLLAGLLLSAAVCLRIPNGPLALIPAIDLLLRRKWRPFALLVAGAAIPLAVFGLVDWATWKEPFHSARVYIDYNFVQGRAAEHGVSPQDEYVKQIVARLGPGLWLLVIPILLRLHRVWTFAVPALLLLILLSTQVHKEERFLLAMWPLLVGAWGGAVGSLVTRWSDGRARAVSFAIGAAALVVVLVGAASGIEKMERLDFTGRWALYDGQAWVGKRDDVTGVLVEGRFHLSGGWMMLGRNVPLDSFDPYLLENPIFNYAIVPERSSYEASCRQRGFRKAWARGGFVVYRR